MEYVSKKSMRGECAGGSLDAHWHDILAEHDAPYGSYFQGITAESDQDHAESPLKIKRFD
jgi:hypothetical protein